MYYRHPYYGTTEAEEPTLSLIGYDRPAGVALPYLKGGATDAMVLSEKGIQGLVSEIRGRIGLEAGDSVTTAEIQAYQTAQGLEADGTIGPATYAALGFEGPFVSGVTTSSGAGLVDPKGSATQPLGKEFYEEPWFIVSASIATVLLGYAGYQRFYKG
jgi:hypothetical protein